MSITFNDFIRLINPIKRKIFLSMCRGILKFINNDEGTQKVQLTALAGETITDAERFQEYGLETYPLTEAELFGAFLNGNRDQGIILCAHDRRYRPKNLSEGEVALYTSEDLVNDFRFWLKTGRIASLTADKSEETLDTSKTITTPLLTIDGETVDINTTTTTIDGITITITGATIAIVGATTIAGSSITLNSNTVSLGGGGGTLRKLIHEEFKTLFNDHVHSAITAGPDDSGIPTVLLDNSHMTTKAKAI